MPFKSLLAVLVLGLCELHLIGSVNNDKIALVIKNDNKDKKGHTISDKITQDETALHIQLTSKDKSQGPTTIHPTSNDKDNTVSTTHPTSNNKNNTVSTTHPTSNDKNNTVSTTHPTSNDKNNTVSTTHPTSNDKKNTVSTTHPTSNSKVFTTQPNTDNALSTRKLPKKSTLKGDTTSHPGGSAATIPSMLTIASLICVLLL